MRKHQCLFGQMKMKYELELGGIPMRLLAEGEYLTGIDFLPQLPAVPQRDKAPILCQAVQELEEYFRGERQQFTVAYKLQGTPFQHQVWDQLVQIPYGCTASYGEVARAIGRPKAARAVGMANHVNPLPFIVPCHRVIGANGSLIGYAGGLEIKTRLLELEKNNKK